MRFILSFLLIFSLALPVCAAEHMLAFSTKPYALNDEDKAALKRIENYLSGIHTLSAEFTQAAPNGDISAGKFYLSRPGKLRMEYAPPTPVLMVASGNDITYYDKELDQVSHIPLESTLVGFLAQEEVKFDNTVIITNFEHGDKTMRVSLIQSKRPKDGTLTLEFSDDPLVIRNMVVTDSSGQVTTVSLNNAHFGAPLAADLFTFKDPHLGGHRGVDK